MPTSIPAIDPPVEDTARLEMMAGQQLIVERGRDGDVLTLLAADGAVMFSLQVTADGPVLRFDGALKIEASGDLTLAGQRVAIRGANGVSIESGADATINVAGDLSTNARIQSIRARLGNVNVTANDDVRLTGERIKLNC